MPRGSSRRNSIITVPDDIIERSEAWGKEAEIKMSRRVDRKRVASARTSAEDRAIGKCAEAALASAMGLDVDTAVEWRVLPGGDGHRDITLTINDAPKVVDVKASAHPSAQYLIWPRTQEFSAMASILVFAKVAPMDSPKRGQVFIPGFCMKRDFIRNNEKMDLRNDGRLTPCLHWKELTPLHILRAASRTCTECGASAHFGSAGKHFCSQHYLGRFADV